MANFIEITSDNYKSTIESGKTLIDFWAPWCGPCKMQLPIVEKLAGEISNVNICKCNVDENSEIAQTLGISSIPTLILFENGQEIERMVGLQSEDSLKSKLS